MQTNEISKANRSMLSNDNFKSQIALALPEICKPDRFLRIALTALTKTPKIADCTPESLASCLLDCASLGIEPDGRRAHLIPYGKNCTLIIDYKGLVELVRRSGNVVKIHADVICENDIFEENLGEVTQHVINRKHDRGLVYACYAMVEMRDGARQCEVMTKDDVEKIRQASVGKNGGPWTKHWDEMAKKTVFRRLCKWLPLATETLDLISKDDKQFNSPTIDIQMPVSKEIEVPEPVIEAEAIEKELDQESIDAGKKFFGDDDE